MGMAQKVFYGLYIDECEKYDILKHEFITVYFNSSSIGILKVLTAQTGKRIYE